MCLYCTVTVTVLRASAIMVMITLHCEVCHSKMVIKHILPGMQQVIPAGRHRFWSGIDH